MGENYYIYRREFIRTYGEIEEGDISRKQHDNFLKSLTRKPNEWLDEEVNK